MTRSWKKKKCSFIYNSIAQLCSQETGGIDRSAMFCIILIATSIGGASLLLAIEQDRGRQLLCNNESKFEKF